MSFNIFCENARNSFFLVCDMAITNHLFEGIDSNKNVNFEKTVLISQTAALKHSTKQHSMFFNDSSAA